MMGSSVEAWQCMHILSCTPDNAYEIGSIVIVLIL